MKRALQLVNEQMDRTFWQLSANTLTSVWSALVLGILMWLAWANLPGDQLAELGSGLLGDDYKMLDRPWADGRLCEQSAHKEDFLYRAGRPLLQVLAA